MGEPIQRPREDRPAGDRPSYGDRDRGGYKPRENRTGDRPSYGEIWDVAEGLISHDELSAQWRALHATVVERQIGYKPGTGGSADTDAAAT